MVAPSLMLVLNSYKKSDIKLYVNQHGTYIFVVLKTNIKKIRNVHRKWAIKIF